VDSALEMPATERVENQRKTRNSPVLNWKKLPLKSGFAG
jgi:hypothetical protein